MPSDYSPQLEEIVKALNRPSIPTWLIVIISASLGFLASILNQVFQHWHTDRRARSTMRKIIYPEIGAMYSSLVHFYHVKTGLPEQKDVEWRKRQLREHFLKFEGEKYAEENKSVFIQLKERSTINEIYGAIREVFGPEEEYGFFINSGLAIEVIEACVAQTDLPVSFVKRYMNAPDAKAIAQANKERLAHQQAKSS
jgi:hypothetical protein